MGCMPPDTPTDWTEKESLQFFASLQQWPMALGHLHKEDWIHGDIKAKNILVSNQGVPYIIDFELSRHLSETGKGKFFGTRLCPTRTTRWSPLDTHSRHLCVEQLALPHAVWIPSPTPKWTMTNKYQNAALFRHASKDISNRREVLPRRPRIQSPKSVIRMGLSFQKPY